MHQPRHRLAACGLDVLGIFALSLVVAGAHFSLQQGRAIVSADSLQYFDNAEAILSGDQTPCFSYRKPGYSFFLAALMWGWGPATWPVVVANHLLQALLPLSAYALGRTLRSRAIGWAAALLVIARVQESIWGERIMSEALYAALLSFGLAAFVGACTSRQALRLYVLAGVLLAAAWFVRPVAIVVLTAGIFCIAAIHRREPRCAVLLSLCLIVPFACANLGERALNYASTGQFRTCTGTFGAMVLMRARLIENLPLGSDADSREVAAMLPERPVDDAFRVNHVDTWVARHHAISNGMDDWEIDSRMARAGVRAIAPHLSTYLRTAWRMFARTLLRQEGPPVHSRVPTDELRPIVSHADAADDASFDEHWYAYWALPGRSTGESLNVAGRLAAASRERAPFGRGGWWDLIGAWTYAPVGVDFARMLRGLGSIWPGFALLLCGRLGLNRRACGFLALCYVFDAVLVGLLGASDQANGRYHWVWLTSDTALAACLLSPALVFRRNQSFGLLSPNRAVRLRRIRERLRRPRSSGCNGALGGRVDCGVDADGLSKRSNNR